MSLINLSNVGKRFGAETILRDVTFGIEPGDHAALIGVNGAGKSTLLRIMAGLEEPDEGQVARERGLRVAYLAQDPDFGAAETLYEAMLAVFAPAIEAQERLRSLELEMAGGTAAPEAIAEYGRLQSIVEHTGYTFRERIDRVLAGLNLERDTWHLPLDMLSGGQRTRASLARTLLQDADLLLLDEPTNHLDIPALEWLESYLRDLKRAFVIVAHDRYLLQRVTRRTLELSFGRLTAYEAPYDRYLQLKAERTERQRQEYDAQQQHIARTEEFIRRYGAGQRYKEARGRQKRLDRLERVERPQAEAEVHLALNKEKRSGDIVLVADHLRAGYDSKPLLELPEQVVLRRGETAALIGPNGSGKSTLLRTLLGHIPPLQGSVRWGANTSVAYYSQTLEGLDPDKTVLEEARQVRAMSEEETRSYLARFLFSQDDVSKQVRVLSGGERSRVALARLILEDPNVLVLDEPTNHLDIASRDALRQVLADFRGTLLFVSHDRYLIDALSEQLWVVEGGFLRRYAGTYSDHASGHARALDTEPNRPKRADKTSPDRRLRELEDEANALAGRLGEISRTAALAQLGELTERYAEVQQALGEAQELWLNEMRDRVRTFSA